MHKETPEVDRNPLTEGVYTLSEVARLLQVSPSVVARWAKGYVYAAGDEERSSGPVLAEGSAEGGLLNFHDLVELFFVREFRKARVPLPKIRGAANVLRKRWGTRYPFALRRIAELNKDLVDEKALEVVLGQQRVFEFAKRFMRFFDFDEEGLATAYYPLGKNKLVVLDPSRSFGAPIEIRSGVRTEVLYRQYLVEEDVRAVADWYEVALDGVTQAVEFEELCRSRAA